MCGRGNFILRLSHQKHWLSVADWKALSEQQRQRVRHAVFSLACEGVAEWHAAISIYWCQPETDCKNLLGLLLLLSSSEISEYMKVKLKLPVSVRHVFMPSYSWLTSWTDNTALCLQPTCRWFVTDRQAHSGPVVSQLLSTLVYTVSWLGSSDDCTQVMK